MPYNDSSAAQKWASIGSDQVRGCALKPGLVPWGGSYYCTDCKTLCFAERSATVRPLLGTAFQIESPGKPGHIKVALSGFVTCRAENIAVVIRLGRQCSEPITATKPVRLWTGQIPKWWVIDLVFVDSVRRLPKLLGQVYFQIALVSYLKIILLPNIAEPIPPRYRFIRR